jgi:multiple sugar transport system substrate-binding protein
MSTAGTDRRGNGAWRSLAVVIAAAAIVASACSGAATSAPATPASTAVSSTVASAAPAGSPAASAAASAAAVACGAYSGPETTIEYAIWGDTTELKNQQAIVDAFMQINPKIKVKVTVADWTTYWDKLQTGLAGGAAPDVFLMDGTLFQDYQTRDVLKDLTPYIQKDGFDLTQLNDLAVKDFTAADGHVYGMPRDLSSVALYYNKKIFDAAGIPYPDETWDWNKLAEVAQKLTKTSGGKTSQWGFFTEVTDMENYWSSLVWQNGGDIVSPDGKTLLIDTDQAAGGLQFLQDLIYKYKVLQRPSPSASAGDNFDAGQAAMASEGSWLVPTYAADGIDFGVAPLPKGPAGRVTSVNPTGVVVSKTTKSPDAAWEFAKCYASPVMQEKIAALKASMPANKQVLADKYATSFDGGKVFADALSYAHIKPSFKGYNEFTSTLQTEIETNLFNDKKMTAKQALDEVAPKLEAILKGGQ